MREVICTSGQEYRPDGFLPHAAESAVPRTIARPVVTASLDCRADARLRLMRRQPIWRDTLNVPRLKEIGRELATIVRDYTAGPDREMLVDPALYAILRAEGGLVSRQYPAHLPKLKRAARIDFRVGGPRPALIEFAVRPPAGGGTLYGSQNRKELHKLTRFGNNIAKLRALLLVDLHSVPHDLDRLKATYAQVNAGRGKFGRFPVQVIYANATAAHSFRWNPYR